MPVIVFALHGSPPFDFPTNETVELFNLHTRLEHVAEGESFALRERYDQLDAKMRAWPRTPENDPLLAGSIDIASNLQEVTQMEVILGFNEFCSPSLEQAFKQTIKSDSDKIIVITPMMTRSGERSEVNIPAAIKRIASQYSDVPIDYIWPFSSAQVAQFLAAQITHFENR
jgi:sirohydrochlorin cobaltochelatase